MSAADAKFLVIGEALVDIVPDGDGVKELPGGSPANVALTLARLGASPRLATVLAADERGRAVRDWLQAAGVQIDASAPGSGRTSTAAVTLDAKGSASYRFDLDWDLPLVSGIEQCDVVHTGSIATVLEPGARSVELALSAAQGNALVSFDPNARPAITPDVEAARRRVEGLVHLSDVVKVSDEDLRWYYPGVDPVDVARAWGAAGPVAVVVTLGGEGSMLVRNDVATRVPAPKVEVADTIGAGDTFMGALLHALVTDGVKGPHARQRLRDLPLGRVFHAVRWAAAAAAITVSRSGANPPTLAELEASLTPAE